MTCRAVVRVEVVDFTRQRFEFPCLRDLDHAGDHEAVGEIVKEIRGQRSTFPIELRWRQ